VLLLIAVAIQFVVDGVKIAILLSGGGV